MKGKYALSFLPPLSIKVTLVVLLICFFVPVVGGAEEPPEKPIPDSRHNPKIETGLELISSINRSQGAAAARKHASRMSIEVNRSNTVKAVIEKKPGSLLTSTEVAEFGGEILRKTGDLVEIRLPVGGVEPLVENVDGIEYLRSPYRPVPFAEVQYGSYFSNGVNLTGGGLFHSKNLLGRGVKIAVIDVGFGSYNYAREAEEFPAGTVVDQQNYTTRGGFDDGGPHGTAVAEIVHDMAPLAELYLKRIDTEGSLREATDDAIAQGVDVIVHSVGWVNTNFGDGTGAIAETTKRAAENGILWVNAAGNSARRHWLGEATDRDGDNWVEFSEGNEEIKVDVDRPGNIQIFLTWNDWPKSDEDFDFYLYDSEGQRVASSQQNQTGNEEPAESISYPARREGSYRIKVAGPENMESDTKLEIFSFNHPLNPNIEEKSIMAPGNVEEVLTVGAINKGNWREGEIAYYSSRGPTEDGRTKPDLTAVDGVTTFVYEDFLGTSAAAPHAAGAAGLILSREPNFGPKELTQALKEDTRDLGEEGPDDVYGWGKMRLLYETPSATRSFEAGEGGVEPGGKVTVSVDSEMPLTVQGGLNLTEEVPEPLEVLEIKRPNSATISDGVISAEWPTVEPGETRKLRYSLLVPTDTPSGEYEFSGSINGNSIGGASNSTILKVGEGDSDRLGGLALEKIRTNMDDHTDRLSFQATGQNIEEIKVKVFSDTGEEVFDSDWQSGSTYQWGLYAYGGKTIPNGVYLYYVKVRGPNEETKRSDFQKYLVLR